MTAIGRRSFLLSAVAASAAALLAACGQTPSSTTAPASSVAASPASAPPAAAKPSGPASAAAVKPSTAAGSAAGQPAASGTIGKIAALSPVAKLEVVVGLLIDALPIYLATDKGYWQAAGLDVNLTVVRDARTTLARLATGEIDIANTDPSPAIYNQVLQGFDLKVLASMSVPKEGRVSDAWLAVIKDEADQIKDFKDLKGKTIEAATEGQPLDLLATSAAIAGGLTPGKDVTIQYKAKNGQDMLAIAQSKGADVLGMPEPLLSQAEKQGLVVRWKTYGPNSVAPWFQPAQLSASSKALQANRAAISKFLEVYLAASREINAANGVWTDYLVNLTAKNVQVPAEVVQAEGLMPYFDPNGDFSEEGLTQSQDLWLAKGLIKQKVDLAKLVDRGPLNDAVQRLGKA